MNRALSSTEKLRLFTVFSASAIILIAGIDAFLEHNSFWFADGFIAIAGFIAFLSILMTGFTLANMLMNPLHKAVDELNMESAETAAASSQVEAASSELAEATLEESASIQETAATLEETSSMINQNNVHTQEAAALSKNAVKLSENSYSEMVKMLDYMEKLKQSSDEISKIVKVIDNIAFQTNILSLNASVEAARAGSEGNAFAVVAEEVRNLAQRSEEAAKNTEVIILNNIQLVDEGLLLANDVENSLAEIDQESKKINSLMEEISVASAEQSKGVNEIHKALAQMEIAVHTNAHAAGECASAARDLSSQSACVKAIVDDLTILVTGFAAVHNDDSENYAKSNTRNLEFKPVKVYAK